MNNIEADSDQTHTDQETEFELKYAKPLGLVETKVDEIDCVILPHKELDQFIAWCKGSSAIEIHYDAREKTKHTAPFTIYTEDEFTRGKHEFNLIGAFHKGGELYEDYGVLTQIGTPLTEYNDKTGEVRRLTTVDFRDTSDRKSTFSDWSMGLI